MPKLWTIKIYGISTGNLVHLAYSNHPEKYIPQVEGFFCIFEPPHNSNMQVAGCLELAA